MRIFLKTIGYEVPVKRLICFLFAVFTTCSTLHAGEVEDRRAAIQRGLEFLHNFASAAANVKQYGFDLMWCFYSIGHTSSDRELSEAATRMGKELAQRWRWLHPHVSPEATPTDLYNMLVGAYTAELLGMPDPAFKAELRKAARRFTAKDFLGFDAEREPPANDKNRYDVWSGALIRTYFGDAYGIKIGAHYRDVLKWMSCFRPYEGLDDSVDYDAFYAVTHVIYTLNRYSEKRIARSLLPQEIVYLHRELTGAMEDEDPEMVGEALDTLRAAGFEDDPEVQKGMAYLVSEQRPDGSWAGDKDDMYTEYHSAWTGVDGLRDYHFRGEVKRLPRMQAVKCR
jgi:hypothetical protein